MTADERLVDDVETDVAACDVEIDDVRAPLRSVGLAIRASWAVVYLAVCAVVLYPILTAPVMADDFVNPFAQADEGGPTLADGLSFAWRGAVDGASFRIVGNLVGGVVNWALPWASATFDVALSDLYAVVKFIMIIAFAASIAWFWRGVAAISGVELRWFEALSLVSATAFTTLQIHSYWSNDPVANYPLVGFGSTALGFVFLGFVLRFVASPTVGRAAIAVVAAIVAVNYYELNIGAVMGASLLLGLLIRRTWGAGHDRWRAVGGSLMIVLLPALLVVYGRGVTGDQSDTYGGTTVRLDGSAVETFLVGMAGTLPAASWQLSARTLGGTVGLVPVALGVAVLVAWTGWAWVAWIRSAPSSTTNARYDRPLVVVAGAALSVYWVFAVGLQAITVKVQDETLGVGYVYMSYSVGAAVVALAVAAALRWVVQRSDLAVYAAVVAAVVLSFVVVQLTVNWRLSEQLNAALIPNRQLLAAFDRDATPPERCQALTNWTAGPWPDYYERGMIAGLDVTYRHYFGEPFCEGFTTSP